MPTDSRISATEMIENICKSNVIETQVSAMSLLGWAHFLEEGGGGGWGITIYGARAGKFG